MTSKVSRAALIAAIAVGASGLVAVPAADAAFQTGTGLVNQPIVTGASQITPESAVITGAVDTGGFDQPNNNVVTSSAATAGGYSVTGLTTGSTWDGGVAGTGVPISSSSITIDGIPTTAPSTTGTPVPTYSGVWVEYDPVADYVASGDTPGPETQEAREEDVDTSTSPYTAVPSVTIGGYPAANAANNGQTPLKPGTKYYYWIVQQTDETTAATTINEFDPVDLYNFLDQTTPAGSGAIADPSSTGGNSAKSLFGEAGDGTTADAFVNSSSVTALSWAPSYTNASDETAWAAGTGIYGANGFGLANGAIFAGKVGYSDALGASETLNLTSLANPDWQCAPDYDLVAGGPFAVDSVGQPWSMYSATGTIAGGIVIGNTTGVTSNSSGSSTGGPNYAPAQPEEQSGSCIDFLGSTANQNFTVSSTPAEFTTAKLGDVKFGSKATLSGNKVTETVQNKSALVASGTVDLTVKSGKKTVIVAKGGFKVAPKDTTKFTLKLTAKGAKDLAEAKTLTAKILYTSNTDQPTKSKKVKF